MGSEALAAYVEFLIEKGRPVPRASTLDDLKNDRHRKDAVVSFIELDESLFRPERVNVMIPKGLLARFFQRHRARGRDRARVRARDLSAMSAPLWSPRAKAPPACSLFIRTVTGPSTNRRSASSPGPTARRRTRIRPTNRTGCAARNNTGQSAMNWQPGAILMMLGAISCLACGSVTIRNAPLLPRHALSRSFATCSKILPLL